MIDNPEINWTEQCKFCRKAINTTYCDRNQAYMQRLQTMGKEFHGITSFECEFFSPDKKLLNEPEQKTND